MGYKSIIEKTKTKPKCRKGLWSPEEDERLRNYILHHGHGCWTIVPINAGLQRNGKSCRLRWINYLRPGLKRGVFSTQEEEAIISLHQTLGNKWAQIAQHLPGRTDNEIKNYWHSYLKKKVTKPDEIKCIPETDHFVNSNCQEDIDSPVKSSITTLSFHSVGKGGGFSTNLNQSIGNQIISPKLFFAEWLNFENSQNNNIHEASEFPCYNYNSKNIDDHYPNTINLDMQEGIITNNQGLNYNEGSCSSDNRDYNVGNGGFDSQLIKFEEQTPENEFGDLLLPGSEILDDLFINNDNVMYSI